MTGMYAVQSVAVIGAGAAASIWSANTVVAGVAILSAVVILALRPVLAPARAHAQR